MFLQPRDNGAIKYQLRQEATPYLLFFPYFAFELCSKATAAVTIFLNRSCPSSLPILPNSFSLQADTAGSEVLSAIVASLSGTIDDYIIQPKKNNTIDVTAKLSYLERFREQTKQTKSITEKLDETTNKFTGKLTEVEDKFTKKLTEVQGELAEVQDELAEVQDELAKVKTALSRLDQIESYASNVLSTDQLYKIIGQGMFPSIYM